MGWVEFCADHLNLVVSCGCREPIPTNEVRVHAATGLPLDHYAEQRCASGFAIKWKSERIELGLGVEGFANG